MQNRIDLGKAGGPRRIITVTEDAKFPCLGLRGFDRRVFGMRPRRSVACLARNRLVVTDPVLAGLLSVAGRANACARKLDIFCNLSLDGRFPVKAGVD